MRTENEFLSMREKIDDLNDLIASMKLCDFCAQDNCNHHQQAVENLTDIVADAAFKWLIVHRHGKS